MAEAGKHDGSESGVGDGLVGDTRVEQTKPEVGKHIPRVLIYGSRGSGASELRANLNEIFLQNGISATVDVITETSNTRPAFLHKNQKEHEEGIVSLPIGVVMLPEMRQHEGGMGMSVPTSYERIEQMCVEHNIPFIRLNNMRESGYQATEQAVAGLTNKLKSPETSESATADTSEIV